MPDFAALDTTELPLSGDLNTGAGAVDAAQRQAADYYGAARSWILTGGSSQGLYAALLALAGRGGALLCSRFVHRAVLHAAIRFSLRVYFAKIGEQPSPPADATSGTVYPYPSADDYASVLARHPEISALVVTSPDYYGALADVEALEALCRRFDCTLLVDAAHGAHLRVCGAELARGVTVMSAHKTLPALTGGAFLHLRETGSAAERLGGRIDRALTLLRGSSPPLFVAASVDWARAWACTEGRAAVERQRDYLALLRRELSPAYRWLAPELTASAALKGPDPMTCDPLRLVLGCGAIAPAPRVAAALAEEGIDCEFADLTRLVFIPSLQSKAEDYKRLAAALNSAAGRLRPVYAEAAVEVREMDRACRQVWMGDANTWPPSRVGYIDRSAGDTVFWEDPLLGGVAVKADLEASVDKPLAEGLIIYPPGIPLLWPGETLSHVLAALLPRLASAGLEIQGLHGALDAPWVWLADTTPPS